VMAIFAEAMMTRTPWKQWDVKTGKPAEKSDVLESLSVLEKAISLNPQHPAILHLHIHATEMSDTPEDALKSADKLGTLCPDAGHMNHMPGHTYVLCGKYEEAKFASEKAIRADNMYLVYAGPFNFYTTSRCHDLHLMMYTCMFLGQFEPAIKAAYDIRDTLTQEVLGVKGRPQLATTMEGYYSMIMHVLVRFGKWQEIIDTPMPPCPDLYCVSTPMHHYAKGIAYATLGQFDEADLERKAFYTAKVKVPTDRKFFNNWATDILAVGEKMLEGEVEYHKGNYIEAYDHLRESIYRNDTLAYTEPWAWMHPPRHALGALLMEQGYNEEAEEVYRTDLGLNGILPRCLQHHDNIWSLHGLAECLGRRGETEELKIISTKLELAKSKTDMPITSSCACRKHVVPSPCCDKNT
ncbi:MAG: tetratricopeptide repeat protein, partial [Kordiimonadaceae bacterium]|nr:tetratricopeptide repeat protein [Kordiimonadaceae bacterium]